MVYPFKINPTQIEIKPNISLLPLHRSRLFLALPMISAKQFIVTIISFRILLTCKYGML